MEIPDRKQRLSDELDAHGFDHTHKSPSVIQIHPPKTRQVVTPTDDDTESPEVHNEPLNINGELTVEVGSESISVTTTGVWNSIHREEETRVYATEYIGDALGYINWMVKTARSRGRYEYDPYRSPDVGVSEQSFAKTIVEATDVVYAYPHEKGVIVYFDSSTAYFDSLSSVGGTEYSFTVHSVSPVEDDEPREAEDAEMKADLRNVETKMDKLLG